MIVRDRAAARAKGIALLPVLLVLAVGGALASAAADDCPSGRCPIPLGPAAPATEQPVDVGVLRRGRAAAVVQPAPASRCGRRVYQRPSWVRCDTAPDPTWCRWQMPRVPRNRRPCEFPIECVR